MLDRLTSMAVFVKASDTGSFAAAASALRLSPQMVAKHVSTLEDRLGAKLLNRTTRRQSLTEIGAMYYEKCQLILAEAEEADSLAAVQKGTPRGRLRVTAPVTFGAHSIAPLVAAYLQMHPEVTVELELTDRLVDIVEWRRDGVPYRRGAASRAYRATVGTLSTDCLCFVRVFGKTRGAAHAIRPRTTRVPRIFISFPFRGKSMALQERRYFPYSQCAKQNVR